MKTYDIVNAGPRNRFMANGRIVSNSGRVVQVQNLSRLNTSPIAEWYGVKPKQLSHEQIDHYLATGISTCLDDCEEFFFPSVMPMLTNSVRGCFVAPPGRKLVTADLSNIEGRYAAWIAEESWKLDAFRNFDNGIGADLYCVAYGKSFGVDPFTVDKEQRQIGKVQELFLQFAGGTGAFVTGATTYRIDLEAMAEKAIQFIPMETIRESEKFMDWMKDKGMPTFNLSDRCYVVCNSFKMLWREAHPAITSYWKEIDTAVRDALANPESVITARKMKFQFTKGWLRFKFPDGTFLCYPQAKIEDDDNSISFMGTNQFTRRWERIRTHPGKLFENIVQGGSRNVFVSSYAPAEAAGFEIVMRIHDELVTETPDTPDYTVDGLSKIMATVPSWAPGLPLAAAGFESYRYRKG